MGEPLNSPTRVTEGTLDTTLSSVDLAADLGSVCSSRLLDGVLSGEPNDATADRVCEDIDIGIQKESYGDRLQYEASTVMFSDIEKQHPSGGNAPFQSHNCDGVVEQSI